MEKKQTWLIQINLSYVGAKPPLKELKLQSRTGPPQSRREQQNIQEKLFHYFPASSHENVTH